MTDKHTPEPWKAFGRDLIGEADDGLTSLIADVRGNRRTLETDLANARRIVACVNALSGISTEAIESGAVAGLVGAVGELLASVDRLEPHVLVCPDRTGAVRTALANMGVKP